MPLFATFIAPGTGKKTLKTFTSAYTGQANQPVMTNANGLIPGNMVDGGVTNGTAVAAGAIAAGKFINLFSDDGGTTLKMRLADGPSGKQADGFVLTAVSDTDTGEFRVDGNNDQVSGLLRGTPYYLGTNGVVTTTPDITTSGAVLQTIGTASTPTNIPFFKSDVDYIN